MASALLVPQFPPVIDLSNYVTKEYLESYVKSNSYPKGTSMTFQWEGVTPVKSVALNATGTTDMTYDLSGAATVRIIADSSYVYLGSSPSGYSYFNLSGDQFLSTSSITIGSYNSYGPAGVGGYFYTTTLWRTSDGIITLRFTLKITSGASVSATSSWSQAWKLSFFVTY